MVKGLGERNCIPAVEISLVLELVKTETLVESGTLKSKLKRVFILLDFLFSFSIKNSIKNLFFIIIIIGRVIRLKSQTKFFYSEQLKDHPSMTLVLEAL